MDEGEPYRPEVIVCVERPKGLVVGHDVVKPGQDKPDESDVLAAAMREPLVGPPRRPDKVFVADAATARAIGDKLDLQAQVGSVPELGAIAQSMFQRTQTGEVDDEPPPDMSYLEGGRVSAWAVAQLFEVASKLYESAPWKRWDDDDVVNLDIPALEISGACISVIGALGESEGFLVFPSRIAFEGFLQVAEQGPEPDGPVDLGTSFVALNFEPGSRLPRKMRKEISKHRWPVAGPTAYPWVQHRERDGLLRPVNKRDLTLATLCAKALIMLVDRFERGDAVELAETIDGYEVRARAASREQAELPIHNLDAALVQVLRTYARERFEGAWLRQFDMFAEEDEAEQLALPLSAYAFEVEGESIVEWFLRDEGWHGITEQARRWLVAQQRSWLSLWEVTEVREGEGLSLVDLLTGERRQVAEVSGSHTLRQRAGLLARVVDTGADYVMSGVHPRVLDPRQLATVVKSVHKYLKTQGQVPIERLQNIRVVKGLVRRWEEEVAAAAARAGQLPKLCNTDGDPMLLTLDHYRYRQGHGPDEVRQKLAALDGVDGPDADGGSVYSIVEPAERSAIGSTLIATIRVEPGRVVVETNSIARADRVQAQLQAHVGAMIEHQAREHIDPTAGPVLESAAGRPAAPPEPSPEMSQAVRAYKADHYRDWADQPLPALKGKTARQSVRTKRGRQAVDLLLREMEHHEAGCPADERYDFSSIRQQLDLLREHQ